MAVDAKDGDELAFGKRYFSMACVLHLVSTVGGFGMKELWAHVSLSSSMPWDFNDKVCQITVPNGFF